MVDRGRILVVFEPGARGEAALIRAAALARSDGSEVTVVTLAPVQASVRCGPCDGALEDAVLAAAERDLSVARGVLSGLGADAGFAVVRDGDTRGLAGFIDGGGFSAVVLPDGRRLGGGVRARRLRRMVSAPVLVGGEPPRP